jgi:hypothetical protein
MVETEQPQMLCNGQWLIFSNAIACVVELGEAPSQSHFLVGSVFSWVADQPYRVNDDRFVSFVPKQVIRGYQSGNSLEIPIYLFVSSDKSGRFIYVGRLSPSYTQQAPGNHGVARFELSPTLASEIWIKLGGLKPNGVTVASVDEALQRLSLPTTFENRFEVLQRVVEYWHGPITPKDGIPSEILEPLTLPIALKRWYGWAGRRSQIMSGQNWLFTPDATPPDAAPKIIDDLLYFHCESQGCFHWATLPDGEDPLVFGRESKSDPWNPEKITLTEHLILTCILEAVTCYSPYSASSTWISDSEHEKFTQIIPPIPISPWNWPIPVSTQFYAKNGVFMYSMSNRDGHSVWIGAKSEKPLEILKPLINKNWEFVSL